VGSLEGPEIVDENRDKLFLFKKFVSGSGKFLGINGDEKLLGQCNTVQINLIRFSLVHSVFVRQSYLVIIRDSSV